MLGPLGVFLPYYGLYLRENAGLRGIEVGAVFAVMPLVGLLAQPFWGQVADRSGLRARVLVLLSFGQACGLLALWHASGFAELLLATALFAAFSRSLIPIALSVTIPSLDDHPHAFGWVRAAGTVGFLASLLALPFVLDRLPDGSAAAAPGGPSEPGLGLLFPFAAGIALLASGVGLAIPNRGAVRARAGAGEWRALLRNPRFVRVVALCFLAFLFLNGPMELFPVFVRARGGDLDTVRSLWLPMLIPEIVLVACFGSYAGRIGARALLAIGIAAGGLRWLLCAAVGSLPWLFPVQALHAVVVAGLMLGAPVYVDSVVPPQLRSTAQALLATIAVGLGNFCSSLLAGWLLDRGGPEAPYWAGGVGALALVLLLPRLVPALPRGSEPGR